MRLIYDEIVVGGIILPVPLSGDPTDADVFTTTCELIVSEYENRSHEAAMRWLTQASYALISHLLDDGLGQLFEDRLEEHGRYAKGRSLDLNPFQPALLAIFAHRPKALNFRRRAWLSNRLWFAYRHFVPPPFLLGFLHQEGGNLTSQSSNGIVPQFFEWVAKHCADVDAQLDARGDYPPEIQLATHMFEREEEGDFGTPGDNDDW